jgi:hypothetical protein
MKLRSRNSLQSTRNGRIVDVDTASILSIPRQFTRYIFVHLLVRSSAGLVCITRARFRAVTVCDKGSRVCDSICTEALAVKVLAVVNLHSS